LRGERRLHGQCGGWGILVDGRIGQKLTHLQRFDGDPEPVDVGFPLRSL
jgi:hypothetical protein